jgi:hypothetical protein
MSALQDRDSSEPFALGPVSVTGRDVANPKDCQAGFR